MSRRSKSPTGDRAGVKPAENHFPQSRSDKTKAPAAAAEKKPPLTARYDNVFKKIFGSKGNIDILRSLLSAVLKLPKESFETITIEDPNLRIENRRDDSGRRQTVQRSPAAPFHGTPSHGAFQPFTA